MNILFYAYDGFNPEQGGTERVSNNLAKGFIAAGHKVFFVALLNEDYAPIVDQLTLVDKTEINSRRNLNDFINFVKLHNINVIVCQHCYTTDFTNLVYFVKKATSVKLLFVFHTSPNFTTLALEDTSFPILPYEKKVHKLIKRFLRKILKKQKQKSRDKQSGKLFKTLHQKGDGIVLLSEKYIPVVQQISQIYAIEKFFAVANPNTYTELEIQPEQKENTILYVGRLSLEKHPEKAMLIWKHIQHKFPDWNFKMIGAGFLTKDLVHLSKTFKLERFTLEGQQNPQAYYAKAKIIVMLSEYEGFPMALTEAMQHGVTPVAFHSFEAVHDIIENQVNGITVEPFSLQEFETNLTYLMENENIREKMAIKAQQSVKLFEIHEIIKRWEEIFMKIC